MAVGSAEERVPYLLAKAREARQGRDRWRAVGPILRELRDRGVTYDVIAEETGISRATAYRTAHWPGSGTSSSGRSAGAP